MELNKKGFFFRNTQKHRMAQPGKIFIGGMPYSMDEERLKAAFEKYGAVTDCMY